MTRNRMIAQYRQPPLPDLTARIHATARASDAARARRITILIAALGFFAFMPYPAINAGNYTAIQAGNLLTLLLAVPLVFLTTGSRHFRVYLLVLIPMCITC